MSLCAGCRIHFSFVHGAWPCALPRPMGCECRSPAIDQRVVEVPGLAFLEKRNIAHAFEQLPVSFELEHSTQCYVFKRTRAIADNDLQTLSDELRRYYPDRPAVFLPPN